MVKVRASEDWVLDGCTLLSGRNMADVVGNDPD